MAMVKTDSATDGTPDRHRCPTAKSVVGLNRRLDNIKQEVLGARELGYVKDIIPKAKNGNDCLWSLVRIYLIFRVKKGRSPAEKEIVKLVLGDWEVKKKILDLLDHHR